MKVVTFKGIEKGSYSLSSSSSLCFSQQTAWEPKALIISLLLKKNHLRFPGGPVAKNPLPMQEMGKIRFDLCVRKIPWSRKWQLAPVFLPGKSHGQSYSSRGCKSGTWLETELTYCHQRRLSTPQCYSSLSYWFCFCKPFMVAEQFEFSK